MDDYTDQIERLLEEATFAPRGHTKIAMLEEAVRLADAHQDLQLGFETRKELMEAALGCGASDQLLVAFSWCAAQVDRDPDHFYAEDILWEYRWVISKSVQYYQVSKAQLKEMIADMRKRYEKAGVSLRAFHLLRQHVAYYTGDVEEARDAHRQWERAEHDRYSDDPETELAFDIDYRLLLHEYDRAVQLARPWFTGQMRNKHFVGIVKASLLEPLVRLGRPEEAMLAHHHSYKCLAKNPRYVNSMADHITFLVLTDHLRRALTLFEKHLPAAWNGWDYIGNFYLWRAGTFLFGQLQKERSRISLRLPESFPLYEAEGKYDIAKLVAWFRENMQQLADAFDARNENDHYSRIGGELEELPKWVTACPLHPEQPL